MHLGNDIGFVFRLATVVGPVAVYFLILGLLNSRRRPQLLSCRQDYALLIVAMCPLFLVPALTYISSTLLVVLLAAALAGAIALVAPAGQSWVIYNMSQDDAFQAVTRSLAAMDVGFVQDCGEFRLLDGSTASGSPPSGQVAVRLSEFPLLRNVTIRMRGASAQQARAFEDAMLRSLARVRAQTTPMAVSLMLVATAMLMAPMTMMAQNMPQIVRLITDLIH